MEMVIMVRRALCRNSIALYLLLFISCKNTTNKGVPHEYVKTSDNSFKQQSGFLYYHNKKFSGWRYELYTNGDTALLVPYLSGKEEGWCRKWYEEKRLA